MKLNNPINWIKRTSRELYLNQLGFHTDRKLIVIESDDWGSIRMPSKKAFKELVRIDEKTAQDAFLANDSLETIDELENLCYALTCIDDFTGRHPCITANFAMANPEFEKIDYQAGDYMFETFTQTYEKYYGKAKQTVKLIKDFKEEHVFVPQLHAREHLNVARWMRDIRSNINGARIAFENNTFSLGSSFSSENYFGYMDAFNYDNKDELNEVKQRIHDAAELFSNVFGYKSVTIAPPCYVWTEEIERALSETGVKMIQTQFKQNVCTFTGTEKMRFKLHYTGQKNQFGQKYSVRNCSFEPTISGSISKSIDSCLLQVRKSFKNKKPAIINSHRLNYIKSISEKNGENGILGLHELMLRIKNEYPDVEFLSSDELYNVMNQCC